jgi:uncharacterized RDD family membrane protein YckC
MEQKPAPFWSRALAFIIDFTFIAVILSGVEWFIPDTSGPGASGVVIQAMMAGGEIVFLVAYFVWGTQRYGTTFGKKIFRLRVVNDTTGERVSIRRTVVRSLMLPFSFVMGAGVLMALFNPRHQAFHDMIAGTRVVKN